MDKKQAPGGDVNKGPGATGSGNLGAKPVGKASVGVKPVPSHTRGKDSKSR